MRIAIINSALYVSSHLAPESYQYQESAHTNLNDAIGHFRKSERIAEADYKKVGYVNLKNNTCRSKSEKVANAVASWALDKGFDGVVWNDSLQTPVNGQEYQNSLVADFPQRDALSPSRVSKANWMDSDYGRWGPMTVRYSEPTIPQGVDKNEWKRDRVIATAMKYKGLKYKREDGMRGHFPQRGCGLDCSNFAAWVYNYGLGIKFSSDVDELWQGIDSREAGRLLGKNEPLKKGDLLFYDGNPKHVVIYVDKYHVIDSTSGKPGVDIRDIREAGNKWYGTHTDRYLGARRPIE